MDFNNAYHNGDLLENVYMCQSPRFEASDSQLVCKLKKILYELKQTP